MVRANTFGEASKQHCQRLIEILPQFLGRAKAPSSRFTACWRRGLNKRGTETALNGGKSIAEAETPFQTKAITSRATSCPGSALARGSQRASSRYGTGHAAEPCRACGSCRTDEFVAELAGVEAYLVRSKAICSVRFVVAETAIGRTSGNLRGCSG